LDHKYKSGSDQREYAGEGASNMGLYVTDVLKQFGLVDYNCWHLEDNK